MKIYTHIYIYICIYIYVNYRLFWTLGHAATHKKTEAISKIRQFENLRFSGIASQVPSDAFFLLFFVVALHTFESDRNPKSELACCRVDPAGHCARLWRSRRSCCSSHP